MKLRDNLIVGGSTSINIINNAEISNLSALFEKEGIILKRTLGNIVNYNYDDLLNNINYNIPSIFTPGETISKNNPNVKFSMKSQPINTFLAAPSIGNGTPSFRRITAEDLADTGVLFSETDPFGVSSLEFTGTKTKTLTITLNNGSKKTANFDDANSTYPPGTLDLLKSGTDTLDRIWSSKAISDYVNLIFQEGASKDHTHTFASITSKPTTLSGYGITDGGISEVVSNIATGTTDVASTSNGSTFINFLQGGAVKGSIKIVGSGSTSVTHTTGGVITITGTDTNTTYTAGNGLTLSGTVFSLPVTDSGSGDYVTNVTASANGLTVTKATLPIPSLITSTSATGVANVATTNTNTYLNIVRGGTSTGSSTQITGSGSVTVSSDASGKLTINGTNTTYTAGTLTVLNTGTATTQSTWTSAILNDWLNGKNFVTASIIDGLASQTWVSDNFISNTHVANGITTTNISNWNTAFTNNHTHSNKAILDATTASFTTALKTKLDGLSNYTLPTASASVLGGIKVGNNLSIDANGVLSSTNTTPNDGTLTLSTGTGLSGSATFNANQSTNSTFTVGIASGYVLPTTAQTTSWDNKQNAITGGATTIASSNLTANRALISNASGKVAVSPTTSTELSYLSGVTSSIQTQLNDKINSSLIGANNGVASLGSDGKINSNQLPALAITETFPVSTQAQMLALTAQQGDVAIRTDINKTFILRQEPASTLANWEEMLMPASGVQSVAMSVPTGLTVTGSPITSTGTLALSYASGYQGFTTAQSTKLAGIATGANNYTLPIATATVLGGIELFSNTVQSVAANAVSTTASRTYGLQLNSAGQAVVNVPWTNTVYTGSNGINVNGTVISPTYGTAANTIAQGNDTRINNGQTAFGWGDFRQFGLGSTSIDTLYNTWNKEDLPLPAFHKGTNHGISGISDNLYGITLPSSGYGVHIAGHWTGRAFIKGYSSSVDNGWHELWHSGNFNPSDYALTSQLAGYVPTSRTITINGVAQNLSANRSWTVPDTVTRLRGTASGTYTSGDLTLLAGANTTITQSGSNITIASTNTNTTYSAGTGLSLTGTTFANTAPNATHTGDVTGSTALTIANSAVTHAKYQNIATQRILGRGAAGTGNVQELTLGANLSLSTAGVLSATDTNTTYSAGTGLTLSGTTFSLPITVSGSGNYVSDVTQTTNGITVTKATLPTTDLSGFVPYTGANQDVNLNTQSLLTDGIISNSSGTKAINLITKVVAQNNSSSSVILEIIGSGNSRMMGTYNFEIFRYVSRNYKFSLSTYFYGGTWHTSRVNWESGESSDISEINFIRDGDGRFFIEVVFTTNYEYMTVNVDWIGYQYALGHTFNLYRTDQIDLTGYEIVRTTTPSGYTRDSYLLNYNNLTNKPTIPTVNNGKLTLSTGTGLSGSATFTANQPGGSTFTVGIASTHVLPTTAQTTTWNNKQDAITGGATTIVSSNLTANRALISNASGKVAVSSTTSTELGYLSGVTSAIQTQLNDKINTSLIGANNGVASLGSDGKINSNQLPALAITETFPVSTQAQMLALTAQQGDVAIRTDINKTFILRQEPASTLANWEEMLMPASGVQSVAMSVPTGLTVTGSPITSTGTLALGYASGYQGFTTAQSTKLAGIATGANNYTLPIATATVLGGIELFSNTVQSVAANAVSTTASRTYGLQLNSAGQAVVNVPWTNTVYTGSNGINVNGTVISPTYGTAANTIAQGNHTHATLTRGTGLTGNNYTGAAATTWAVAYGTTAGTAAQGNDSRINNGQTAFGWGRGIRIDGNSEGVHNLISLDANLVKNSSVWINSGSANMPNYGANKGAPIVNFTPYKSGSTEYGFSISARENRILFNTNEASVVGNWLELYHTGNFNPSDYALATQLAGYVPTSRTLTAGNGLSGGGNLTANRTFTLGTPSAITLSSTNSVAASSHTHAFTPGGTTAQYIRGDGSLATYSDTTYTAGTGLSLSGTTFGQTITTSGTGTFVTGITQTTDGFQINLGTPPNTNTTYSNMAIAELNTGTVATGRVISASVLNQWLNGKDYVTNSALLASQQIYQYEVNVSNTLHDTLRDLDSKYLYEVNLVVTSTGTVTGAKQVIVYETNEWKVYDIGTVLKNSNHPYFEIIDNLPKLRTQHVTNYLVSVTVRKYRVVNADNNWKRYLGVGFEALLDKPTTLVGYGITNGVETSRTITINGVTQNLSANRSWTVADTITRLRGTTSGTYASGDLTLLAGANTTITQSGTNITIASTNTNTTYTAGNGLTLSGTAFSITKATATGTGNVVSDYNVTSTGIQLVKGITAMETSHVANGITSTLITNWNTAFTNNHTHSNKSNLDTINQNLGKTSDVLFGSINSNNITVLGLTFNMLELKRSGSTGSSVLFSNSTNGNLGKVGFGQNGDLYITKGASADSSADLLMISGSTGLPRFSGLSGSGTRVVSIGTDGTLAPITPTIDYILGAGNSTSKNIKFIGEGSIISEANGTKLNMLAHQKFINETSTGILTIKHATVASATMFDVVIKVYGYKSKYMGEYRIAFYQYSATSIHASTGYIIGTGNLPSKVVKVGLDADGKISIMIGDTTTSWSSHLSYTLERVETKHYGFSNSSWDNGWTSEMVTSLTGYTSIVTIPMTDIGGNYDLPTASASVLGGVKVGTNLSINASGVLSATNTNTTYSAGNGLTLNSNNQFSIGRITSGSGNVVSDVTITSTGISVVKGITAMTTSHLANLIDQNLNKVSSPTFNSIELSATAPFIDFHYDNSTADYTSRIIENSLGGLNLISKTSLKYNVDDVTTPFLEIDRYKAILGANVSNFEAVYLKTVFGSLNFDDEGLIYRPNSINHSFGIEANINAYYDIELYGKLNSLNINGRGSLGSPLDLLNGTKLSNYVFADVSNKNALGTFRVEGTITKDGGIPVFARWGASILAQTGDTMFTLSANPITPEIFVSAGGTTNNVEWNKKLAFSENEFTIKATAFYEGSLRKLKENIKPFNKLGIELINSLDIVTFDRIDDKTKNKIGIIADDTSEEFLSEDKDAVDLYKTIFIQAKAIQELSRENKELVNKNNELEKRLERLERMLENLLEK